jgi:hypothetical protein
MAGAVWEEIATAREKSRPPGSTGASMGYSTGRAGRTRRRALASIRR